MLVVAVGATLHLLDLQKGLAAELRADVYFRFPRKATATIRNAITYTVLDVEKTGVKVDSFSMAEVTVARSSDLGVNDEQFVCLSHLGNILHAGDEVLGYDLIRLQSLQSLQDSADDSGEWPKGLSLPDLILVKKVAAQLKASSTSSLRPRIPVA